MRYFAFRDEVRFNKVVFENGDKAIFHMPMPRSWSNKKKKLMDGKPHTQRSDVDNLLKALLDSIYEEDSHIWDISIRKVWSYEGAIEII